MLSEKPLFTNESSASVFTPVRSGDRARRALLTGGSGRYGVSGGSPGAVHWWRLSAWSRAHGSWQRARVGEARGRRARQDCFPHVAAGINQSMRRPRPRPRPTFMSREQLTAEARKHESRPLPPRCARPPVLTYSAQGAPAPAQLMDAQENDLTTLSIAFRDIRGTTLPFQFTIEI